MSIHVPEVGEEQVTELVQQLNTKGFACLPNFIAQKDLEPMQAFVASALDKSGHEYVHFDGPDAVAGSGLEELARSPEFEKLMHSLYEHGTGKPAFKEDFYQVLRCLSGATGQKNSLIFHYDSYVVTALVPIEIPAEAPAGDLLMYPNTRRIRSNYLVNVVDKILLDNPLTQWVLRSRVKSNKMGPVRIKMLPGSLYFFWGYRSIHTNEPCSPDEVRATALYHYANPHRKKLA